MVDLAYWSDFDTSRRDAASAFATLSMNGNWPGWGGWGYKNEGSRKMWQLWSY